jgi:hypothetical protein
MVPPATIADLLGHGALLPWKVQEAQTVWLATRRETATTASPEAAERLLALTIALANHLTVQNDRERLRALFEGALDVFSLPRQCQFMRGYLARHAIAEGDLAAAEEWLAPCDPASDDLQTDSSYRFSVALLATAKGNLKAVVEVLGKSPEDVPILDMWADPCTVLRANAWEKSGERGLASRQLRMRMLVAGRAGRQAMDGFVALHPPLRLCATTLDTARSAHMAEAIQNEASVAAARRQRGAFRGMRIFGVLLVVVGAVALAINDGLVIFALIVSGVGVFYLLLSLLGVRDLPRAVQRAEHLYRTGVQGYAGVVGVLWDEDQNGGTLDLVIEVAGHPDATTRSFSRRNLGERNFTQETLKPGVLLPIRYDPRNPRDFIFDS